VIARSTATLPVAALAAASMSLWGAGSASAQAVRRATLTATATILPAFDANRAAASAAASPRILSGTGRVRESFVTVPMSEAGWTGAPRRARRASGEPPVSRWWERERSGGGPILVRRFVAILY
jgi:hypothetical protein